MAIGLVGRKIGMTRIFNDQGASIPVTVVEVLPNTITQIKTNEKEGYQAIQVTTGNKKASRVKKTEAGHFAKAGVEAGRGLWEFRFNEGDGEFEVGGTLNLDKFKDGDIIDVTATSKGKGFAGVVKRHNFRMQDATHGNSLSHRAPGSIGQNQTPGRVFKGKKMAGHLGSRRTTTQNLTVARVDNERNVILVRGAVPGAPGSDVIIRHAVKAAQPATA